MKPRILLIIISIVTIFFSCGKDDNGLTDEDGVTSKAIIRSLIFFVWLIFF